MQATDILKREHETIDRGLSVLGDAAAMVRAGQPLPRGFQSWIVSFIREFADHRHHGKEEQVLFPLLEQRGIRRDGGPIGCMLHEHELGRQLIAIMALPLEGDGADRVAFVSAAEAYVALLRQHIAKENNILFAMADRVCSPADDQDALSAFQRQDESMPACGQLDKEIGRWQKTMAIAPSPEATPHV